MAIQMYDVAEVAEICRVTEATVREWIKDKRLAASKPGRAYLIEEEDLRAFLKERNG